MYNDCLSNNDESVKANVNLIKELIDVKNGVKWVHTFDMQNIMCISMCLFFPFLLYLFLFFLSI